MSMYYDNQVVIYITRSLVFHERTKQIEVDYQFVRDALARKLIFIPFTPSFEEIADIFTKPITARVFFLFM